jgi:crotonobetainyl-CoA:carnitine CoA-transferase CaiB-like acyl-CoA transferase
VLEQPALAEDERFASNSERVENRDDLYQDNRNHPPEGFL